MKRFTCPDCGRRFKSETSLEQHKRDSHLEVASKSRVGFPRKRVALYAIVVLAVVNLAGYSVYSWLTNPVWSTAPTNLASEGSGKVGISVGDEAPHFVLKDPEKGTISKKDFVGRPLFMFFTTTWCVPCQIGAENLARYDDETGGRGFNVLIVFVDNSEPDRELIEWRKRFGRSDWFIVKDSALQMVEDYKVQYLDTKYVLDRDGIVRWKDLKPLDYSSSKQILQSLL